MARRHITTSSRPVPSRRRLIALPLTAAVLTAGLGALTPATPAAADIRAQIASAQARLTQLDARAEMAAERYNAGRLTLTAAEQRAAAARRAETGAAARVQATRAEATRFTIAAYTGGRLSAVSALVDDGGPQTVLDRYAVLDVVGHHQTHVLDALRAAQDTQSRAQVHAAAAVTAQQAALAGLTTAKQQVSRAAAEPLQLLRELQAKQAVLARQAKRAADRSAATAQAAALGRQATATSSAARTFAASPATPAATPRIGARSSRAAAVAVATALAQLGKPYVWAAAGPNSFDCSGLTMYAYARAGIALPHFTGAQWNVGRHVGISELVPGDLLFFYSDRHHMGMYIGGGQWVHAPHTGDVVKIDALSGYYSDKWAGAVRVVG